MAAPSKFAHVVFSTHRWSEMIDWYGRVFEGRIQHRGEHIAFLTYDDEHHRFAFIDLGPKPADGAPARDPMAEGVHHLAYTWDGLGALVDTYKRLKASGIVPHRPIRHGFTLSMYYRDPDGNGLEFQIDLMDVAEANAFMAGPAFAANPIGELFDPEQLVARWDAGQPVDDLIFRSDQPEHLAATPLAVRAAATRARFGAPARTLAAE